MQSLREMRLGKALRRAWHALATGASDSQRAAGDFPIHLDYPVRPEPRYGYGKPPHSLLWETIDSDRERYRRLLERFLAYTDDLLRIPLDAADKEGPYWHNSYITGMDAIALYGMLCIENPARYMEVGSGHSTKFARRAIRDHGLRTTITSIDPKPRAEVDALCDRIIRAPLEAADLAIFGELEADDVLFFDGSHRCFPNSDVTVAFLDVLPALRSGVIVEFHDITLPWDYPQAFCDAYYSEQYLLASYLLAGGSAFEILLPNFFVTLKPDLHHILDPIWDRFAWSATATNGLSFWLRKA